MKVSKRLRSSLQLSGVALTILSTTASAVISVDGSRDVDYGATLAVQTVETQFGDAGNPNGIGVGGELNAGYAAIQGGRLHLMLTGNLEPNFNKMSILIDSVAGGENVLDVSLTYDFSDISGNLGRLTFDAGFEADYHHFGRWGDIPHVRCSVRL